MKKFAVVVPICAMAMLAGCETPQNHAERVRLTEHKAEVVTYPGNIRGAYVFDRNSNAKFCAEPPPDVALSSLQEFAAKLNVALPQGPQVGGEAAGQIVTEVVQLAGRSQILLVARELLYRACELSLNGADLTPADRKQLYDSVIGLVRDLGQAELQRARADTLRRAQAAKEAGVVIDEILGTGQ